MTSEKNENLKAKQPKKSCDFSLAVTNDSVIGEWKELEKDNRF